MIVQQSFDLLASEIDQLKRKKSIQLYQHLIHSFRFDFVGIRCCRFSLLVTGMPVPRHAKDNRCCQMTGNSIGVSKLFCHAETIKYYQNVAMHFN